MFVASLYSSLSLSLSLARALARTYDVHTRMPLLFASIFCIYKYAASFASIQRTADGIIYIHHVPYTHHHFTYNTEHQPVLVLLLLLVE